MKVTWIVPNTLGFLVDELESLAPRLDTLRVLSSKPIPDKVRNRLDGVELIYCEDRSLIPAIFSCPPLREIFRKKWLVECLRNSDHIRKIAGIYTQLTKVEEREPSDLIHSHFAHPGGFGGAFLRGVPRVVSFRGHDVLTTGNYGSLWNPFYKANLIRSLSNSGTVTVGSSYARFRARQILGIDADLRLLEEGVIADSFKPSEVHTRRSMGIPSNATVFLTVGNLVKVKNHRLILDALSETISRNSRPIYLLVAGDGDLGENLKAHASRLGISSSVQFLGRLERGELTDIFDLSDVLVHASMSEGFGNVIIEAMLHRLIVVSSPVGIAPDVISDGKNGYLPELGSKDQLVECLMEASEKQGLMGVELEKNRETALERFSMQRRISGYMALYRELIDRSDESEKV